MDLLPSTASSWVALGLPALFAFGAALVPGQQPLRWAARAAALGVAGVVALGIVVAWSRPASGAFVQLDLFTGVMLGLVCVLGFVVARYSATYLEGEPGQRRAARALLVTLLCVTTLVLARNLAVMAVAWMVTSLSVHQLLTFYPERKQALIAAHKKFIVSRLADVCLLAALGLIGATTGSLELDAVHHFVARQAVLPPMMELGAVLVVIAVALKSAQVPFHGWLTQVMEAPTPVSALLHAGVVNLGGFVLIRLSPLMTAAPVAMALLVVIGLTTAVVGGLVMMTRVSVKLSLAWSTCAQLGFMLVQCGLGAWHLAFLHLVAHSLYKAHAFLISGSAVEVWRVQSQLRAPKPTLLAPLAALALVAGATVSLLLAGAGNVVPLTLTLALGSLSLLAPLATRSPDARRGAAGLLVRGAGMGVLFLGWHLGAASLFPPGAEAPNVTALSWLVSVALLSLAALQLVLQARPDGRLAQALQPRLFAGFHLDEFFTRFAFRLWPAQLAGPPGARPGPSPSPQAVP